MVGGTGLYIDSVIFDYKFQPSSAERDPLNPRHLKKSTDVALQKLLRPGTLVIGIEILKEELKDRITKRVESMINQGLEAEVRQLSDKYGWETEAMTGVGYREWRAYFAGEQSLEETKQLIITRTMQYAKRQRTWFKRNKSIQWVSTPEQGINLIEQFIVNQTMN